MHGTYKFEVAGSPAHAARNRQAAERTLDELGYQLGGRLALLGFLIGQPFALVGRCPAQRVDFHAALLRERLCGRCRIAIVVKGDPDGRALLPNAAVFLPLRQVFNKDRQPARACIDVNVSMLEPRLVNAFA